MKIVISEPSEFESLVGKRVRLHVSLFTSSTRDDAPYWVETHFGDVASVTNRVESRTARIKIWMHGCAEAIQIENDRFVTVEYELIDETPVKS